MIVGFSNNFVNSFCTSRCPRLRQCTVFSEGIFLKSVPCSQLSSYFSNARDRKLCSRAHKDHSIPILYFNIAHSAKCRNLGYIGSTARGGTDFISKVFKQ